jgi:3-isopropylmalate/(R)-2-methylmalate dehydratase small subunit
MMERFRSFTGIAAPLAMANVDTNQLCPTRYNKRPRGPEFSRILFHDLRFNSDGTEKSDFILNREPYRKTRILIAGRNFGCGSSRESAVIALYYFGIRCVIATSFGDIFHNNCFRNGVLPVCLSGDIVDGVCRQLQSRVGAQVSVDFERQAIIGPDGTTHPFDIHPLRKRFLAESIDELDVSLEYRGKIEAFEAKYRRAMPWARPQTPTPGNDTGEGGADH